MNTTGSSTRTADQRGDVEEAPVVQGLARLAPAGQPVGLRVDELAAAAASRCRARPGTRRRSAAAPTRAPVGPPSSASVSVAALERLLDACRRAPASGCARPRPPSRRRTSAAYGGAPPVAQQRPERRVEVGRLGHRHVVGHDVDDDAEPGLAAARSTSRWKPRGRRPPREMRVWSSTS